MAIWPGRVAVALGLLLLLASQSVEAACPTSFASGLECYGRGSCIADTYCQCDPGSFGEDCFFIGQAIPRGDLSSWHTPTANDAMTRVFVSGAWDTIWRSQAGHIAYYDSAEDQFYTLNVFFSGGTIRQIVRVEDELFVGGSAVVAVGLENSTNLVYYEGESGTWNEFVAAGATEAGLLSSVYAIVPNETDSSTLYLAGYFWNVGDDLSIQYAMRLDRTTKQAYQLGTSLLTFKTGGYVRDLKIVQNRYVWVGGSFEDAGGLLGNDHLACWDAWTNTWLPLATPLGDNIVQKLHYVPALDELFVVGSFNSVPWTTSEEAEYFASYSISAGQWTARNVDPNNPGSQFLTSSVDGITFDPFHNVLYLTGFSTPLSTFDLETMSFDTSYTAADLGYPSFQGTDAVLPWDADRVVLAGDNVAIFDSFRVGPLHVYRPNEQKVVALNGNDQTASGVLVDFWIHALTRTGANGMLFGGSFEFVGGVASSGYNLYNSVFWDELPSSFSDGTVKAAVSHGTTMYVARDPAVSHPCGSLTRWNQATGWECLPNFPALGNSPIYALHLLNDTLYIGGDFLFLDGVDGASYCVEYHIDTETWGLIAPNVQLDDSVQAFTSSGVFLYMVGLFTRVEAATDAVGLAVLNTETKTWITYPQYANVPEFASNANPFAAVSIYPLDAEDNPQFIITNGEIFGVSLSSNTTAKYNAIYQPATGLMYLFDSVLVTFGAPQMSCDVGDLQFICGDMTSNTTRGNYVWAWDWGMLNFVPMGTATRLVESDEFLNGCLDLHCTDEKIYVVGYSLEIETVADGSRSPAGVAVFDIATREWEAGLLGVNTIQHVFRVNDDPRTHGVNTIVTGLDAAFGVATNQSFEIQTRSYWMENRTTGGDVLTLNVSGLSGLAVDDRGDGTYGVAWSTTAAGNAVPLDVVVNSLAAREGPFLLDIEPEAADVTQTSMEENFPTANVSAVGWVGFAVRDSYGNVRASAADMVAGTITRLDSGANVPVSFALDTTTGMRRMYHNITLVGAYRLSLSINGLVVPNHPVDLILTPAVVSGPQSEIVNKDVPGLVGTAGALRLIGRDAFSNLVTVGGATIGVSFRVGGTNVPVVIADYGNGTYDIQYTAGIPAVYTLDVDVNGAPAADSPFSFTIQALCNPGDFAETAIGPCTPCEGGSYTDQINLDACLLCPADTISPARAASLQACACSPGFYAEATGIACDPCPEGALCAGDLTPPEALPGYFPAESVEDGLVFLPCPVADACLGGAPLECAEGYMGAACAECSADFYKLAGTCRECSGSGVALLVLFALACVVFCAFLVWLNAQDRKINRFAALAIGINSLQISAIYGQLNVNWPEVVASLLNVLSFANFNLELTSPECSLGASSFYLKWYITMLLPIYFALCFGIVYACGFAYLKCVGSGEGFRAKHPQFTAPPGDSRSSRCRYRCSKCFTDANLTPKTLRHTIVRSFYQILVIAYLPLTAATIKFYACEERDGAHYFQTEPAQPCYDGKYWRSLVPAIVFTVLYPIGIPAYIVGLLRYKAKSMEEFKFYLRYGYFVGRYKTEYYLYETAIMLRKFGVVVAMLFATQDEAVRIGLAITVLFASHVIHMRLDPYNARVHNAIESVSLISAMFVLFCGALLDDEKYASSSLLTALILIAIIGTLLAIAVAIAFDLARLSEEEGAEDMDAIDAMNFGRDTVDGKGDIPSFAIEMSSVASETPNSLFHIDNDDGTLTTGFDRRRETNEMNPFESTQGGVILAPVDSRPSSLMASGFTMTNIHSDGTMTDDVITGTMHSLEQFASGPDPIHTAMMSSVARPAPPKRPRPPGSRAATVVDDDTAPMTYVEWEDGSDDDGVEFKM